LIYKVVVSKPKLLLCGSPCEVMRSWSDAFWKLDCEFFCHSWNFARDCL